MPKEARVALLLAAAACLMAVTVEWAIAELKANRSAGRSLIPGSAARERSAVRAHGPGGDAVREAVLLTGSLGLGHEMMARCCASLLDQSGWQTRNVDSMSLLGRRSGGAGERVFGRLVAMPGLYDGLHFAHLAKP